MPRDASKGLNRYRNSAALSRRQPYIAAKKRILVVCEGSKTEPNYFKSMRIDLKISSADVRICGEECGTDPMSVLDYALSLFQDDSDFDEVYCVFDKEGSPERKAKYDQAINKISRKKLKGGKKIFAIRSVPCFEYWYILHYKFTTTPFLAEGGKSCGDMTVSVLKKYVPNYDKANNDMYAMLKDLADTAKTNALRAAKVAEDSGTDHPTTNVHELVDALRGLRA